MYLSVTGIVKLRILLQYTCTYAAKIISKANSDSPPVGLYEYEFAFFLPS